MNILSKDILPLKTSQKFSSVLEPYAGKVASTVLRRECHCEVMFLSDKHIQTERVDDYKYLLVELLNLGYTILSVTIDGKRGVNSVFKDYPVQMCHFHQKRIIQRYITLHPKLEASQELKKIMTRLKYSDENRFTKALDIWYIKYKSFLDEPGLCNRKSA